MNIHDLAVSILLSLSSLIGIHPVSLDKPQDLWTTEGQWKREGKFLTFEAKSRIVPSICQKNGRAVLNFPPIVQGAHEIRLDGRLVAAFGDPTFETVRSFYGTPTMGCHFVADGEVLSWKVYSFVDYFARIKSLPTVDEGRSWYNLFAETFHIFAAGGMILIGVYSLFLFSGSIPLNLLLSVVLSCFFFSFYFFGSVSGFYNLNLNMLLTHKIADAGVWLGYFFILHAMHLQGTLGIIGIRSFGLTLIMGVPFILFGGSSDVVQLGTTVLSAGTIAVVLSAVYMTYKNWVSTKQYILKSLSLYTFLISGTYDLSFILGINPLAPIVPLGYTVGILFLVFSVNQQIVMAYKERDHLRNHLQDEVDHKTKELRTALDELKTAQAELIQSAKLASLGTLAAGIAHEINNSLNFVNGAMVPLHRLVLNVPELKANDKVQKLIHAMNEGMRLTVDIIKSLRNYTGLNQAQYNDVSITSVVHSVLTILKRRIGDRIEVKTDIPDTLTIFGSVVGLNQVLMNLISNAVDATEAGTLSITAKEVGDKAEIRVSDTGKGMPKEVADRIFEPFFTTKEVGKGTGLGLHIVKSEIDKHKGQIKVQSEPGQGTTFTLIFPRFQESQTIETEKRQAA